MSLTPGARLGVYEIVGLIGAGGMGEVYRARDAAALKHPNARIRSGGAMDKSCTTAAGTRKARRWSRFSSTGPEAKPDDACCNCASSRGIAASGAGAYTNISPNGLLEVMQRLATVINEAHTSSTP